MKIYIVIASAGSYDSHHTWIHSVHTEDKLAQELKNKINQEWEDKRNILSPFPVDKDGDLIEEGLTEEDIDKYHEWWYVNNQAREWNDAIVKEYELNKTYDK